MNTLAKMLVECTKCNMAQGGQKWSKMVTVKMVKSLLRRTNWRIGESECLDLFSHTFNLLQTQVNTQRCVMHPFAVLLCNQMYFTCSLIFILLLNWGPASARKLSEGPGECNCALFANDVKKVLK